MAKDNPPVTIIASGTETLKTARMIEQAITSHPEFKRGKKVTISLVEKSNSFDLQKESVIVVFARSEMDDFLLNKWAPHLTGLPIDRDDPQGAVEAALVNSKAGSLTFNIRLMAPEPEQAADLWNQVARASFGHYSNMRTRQVGLIDRVTAFGPTTMTDKLTGWGVGRVDPVWTQPLLRGLGDDHKARPFEKRAYFVTHDQVSKLPPEASAIYRSLQPMEDEVLAVRSDNTVLFAAPTEVNLGRLARRIRTFNSVPVSPERFRILDLRSMGPTAVILSNYDGFRPAETFRADLSSAMRQSLGIDVRERGEALRMMEREVVLQDLLGSAESRKRMRDAVGQRFVWLVAFRGVEPKTDFNADQRKITSDPGEFRESAPYEPSRGGGIFGGKRKPDEQYQREMAEWRRDYAAWERRKHSYEREREYETPVQWEQSLTKNSSLRVNARLMLIDLDGAGKVVSEVDVAGAGQTTERIQNRTVTIRGHLGEPNSLVAPTESSVAEGVYLLAAKSLASNSVAWMEEHCRFLGAGEVPPEPEPAKPPLDTKPVTEPKPAKEAPAAKPQARSAAVALTERGTITLNIGADQGVQVGDKFRVIIAERVIKDPKTQEVLDRKITESLVIKVSEVRPRVATGAPTDAAGKKLLRKVKPGMRVERI